MIAELAQLSKLERKSIERMALQVEGGNVRAMQRFATDEVWNEAQNRKLSYMSLQG